MPLHIGRQHVPTVSFTILVVALHHYLSRHPTKESFISVETSSHRFPASDDDPHAESELVSQPSLIYRVSDQINP